MRTLWTVYEPGDDRAYQALIPAPFGPPRRPLIQVSVASVDEVSPRTLRSYREATLLVAVRLGLTEGWYPVMMPVTSRVAQWRGRWRGFPAEVAEVAVAASDAEWRGVARMDATTLLELWLAGSAPSVEHTLEPRTQYVGVPIFTLVPPGRGPRVVATTVDMLDRGTMARQRGTVSVSADAALPWAPLLTGPLSGCLDAWEGTQVLRHGRVASRFAEAEPPTLFE